MAKHKTKFAKDRSLATSLDAYVLVLLKSKELLVNENFRVHSRGCTGTGCIALGWSQMQMHICASAGQSSTRSQRFASLWSCISVA